ncbi:MAG: radical SAM protein [Chitinophagales bacterium]|nr:MAG: radical SAM protein [Chitinophagales bacterium]
MVYADEKGRIRENPLYEAVGRSGKNIYRLRPSDFIELPEGSELFFLPGRTPLGYNKQTRKIESSPAGVAVAAFIAPAHTQTFLSAYASSAEAPVLPLYAYTAAGWLNGKFYVTALRVDSDIRQDVNQFRLSTIQRQVALFRKKYPDNRLVDHLATNCALSYHCRAAQNYFLNRWECPLPVSPACNAECIGCISLQPEEHPVSSAHFRLKYSPSAEEIAEIAIDHLNTATNPIVSFGQGCEGEPLLVWETLREAIYLIRKKTQKGIINLNTNGSRPQAVKELCRAGLQSIRVSMNSAQPEWYTRYYLPRNYNFDDVKASISVVRSFGGWASINYFTYPGLTDSQEEYYALRKLIRETDLSMIQWRNFNIDPDWYLKKTGIEPGGAPLGIPRMMQLLKKEFPRLRYGYFNPYFPAQSNNKKIYPAAQGS